MTTTNLIQSKYHYALPTLLIFGVILFGMVFYLKPLWDEVTLLTTTRHDSQLQKDNLAKQLQELQDLQASLGEGTEVSKETTLNAIPERLEQDKLIMDLIDIARQNNVILNGINFGLTPVASDKIKRATINVNVTGNEEGLIAFLKGVETNHRKMLVKTITVQSGKTDSGIPRVNFSVNMETFYQSRI